MAKTSSISFIFCNPADTALGYAPEKGKITLTVESDAESAHELLQELDFEEKLEGVLKESFCADGGRVVPAEIVKILSQQ